MYRLNLGAALAAALIATAPGCSSPTSAYIPNAATARESLDAALDAWRKGGKSDQLATGESPMHFVDSQWDGGQVLESYQILDEELAGKAETEKRYAVVLKMKKPPGEQLVEYIAVGSSPMWIFRDADYEKQVSMGEEAKSKPSRRTHGR